MPRPKKAVAAAAAAPRAAAPTSVAQQSNTELALGALNESIDNLQARILDHRTKVAPIYTGGPSGPTDPATLPEHGRDDRSPIAARIDEAARRVTALSLDLSIVTECVDL